MNKPVPVRILYHACLLSPPKREYCSGLSVQVVGHQSKRTYCKSGCFADRKLVSHCLRPRPRECLRFVVALLSDRCSSRTRYQERTDVSRNRCDRNTTTHIVDNTDMPMPPRTAHVNNVDASHKGDSYKSSHIHSHVTLDSF